MPLFEPGTRIASHLILRFIAAGRVAEIYEVLAPDGRHRALKVLKPNGPLTAKYALRFGQEAEVIAIIEHTSVLRFYGAGIDGDHVWLLLEFVDGPDLRQLVHDAGGALPVHRAVSIIRQACEGVAAAHAQGILHRDLKPENILVAADDVAKVADFGSAKIEDVDLKTTTHHDVSSVLYLAPERFRGSEAGEASDVYAMGNVLYEILAGEHPIVPQPASMLDICRSHLEYLPPPLATLGLEIPWDVSALVEQAMSKDPGLRPSMSEMADALAAALQRLNAPRRAVARNLPLPNRADGHARTLPGMPASGPVGVGGTISMSAFESGVGVASAAPAAPSQKSGASSQRPSSREAAPPPVPSVLPATLRSPSSPGPVSATAAMPEVDPTAERASTGIPVERSVTRASRAPRGVARAVALVGVAGVLAAGLSSMVTLALIARGTIVPSGEPAPAAAPPVMSSPPASASAAPPETAAPVDAGAPRAKASASAPLPARLRPASPARSKLPFR